MQVGEGVEELARIIEEGGRLPPQPPEEVGRSLSGQCLGILDCILVVVLHASWSSGAGNGGTDKTIPGRLHGSFSTAP